MAAPHIVGVVALMREAAPDLAVEQIKQILYDTAVDLGAPGKDNNYGWGVVDAYAAVQQAIQTAALTFSYPDGRPELIDPNGGEAVRVIVSGTTTPPVPDTGKLHYSTGGGFVEVDMVQIAVNEYRAVFPALPCGADVAYYFSVETENGDSALDPNAASGATYGAQAFSGRDFAFHDDFETDQGWDVASSQTLTSGEWERGEPVGIDSPTDLPSDADGSGQCFMTGNSLNENVSGGATQLTSPPMDAASIDDPMISFWRWYANGPGFGAQEEVFYVSVTDDGGNSFYVLETVGPTGDDASGGWFHRTYRIADIAQVTSDFRIRFTVYDSGNASLVEAAVDGVALWSGYCVDVTCDDADFNGDGHVGFADLTQLLNAWGPCGAPCPEDINGNGGVDFADLTSLLGFWGPCL